MRTGLSLAILVVALAAFATAGCGTAGTNADLQSTGLKATPKLTHSESRPPGKLSIPAKKLRCSRPSLALELD